MNISLGFVTKPVQAENTGSEDVHRGYRYIKPEGVATTAGSASQSTKASSAAKDTGAQKTNPDEQAKRPNENASAATTNLSTKDWRVKVQWNGYGKLPITVPLFQKPQ
ncbi:hypothetical protein [Methylobacter svalbardensis]|uniref:hypothetical protein n=1 Tax=Methylobacter svalbardensis TaxID=3080016 RepID=UPI0030ED1B33